MKYIKTDIFVNILCTL